jgi:hypothetical protein
VFPLSWDLTSSGSWAWRFLSPRPVVLNLCQTAARSILFSIKRGPGSTDARARRLRNTVLDCVFIRGLCCDTVSILTCRQMTAWLVSKEQLTWKEVVVAWWVIVQAFTSRDYRKLREASACTVSTPTELRTKNLPNIHLERYRYTNMLRGAVQFVR